jgi:integrase/recombinase XerD
MLRAKHRAGIAPRADALANHPWQGYLKAYLDWSRMTGRGEQTIHTRERAIRRFALWCIERGLNAPQDITLPILERYQHALALYRKRDGEPLTHGSQQTLLAPLIGFFKWLARSRHILYNPASELVLPRLPRRLPQQVLSIEEVDSVLNQPDLSTPAGVRDRAMLETLYSTAIRRTELVQLQRFDLDLQRGMLRVRQGKGNKDRMVPVGNRACAWLEKYLNEVRGVLIAASDDGTLFLTDFGEPFAKNRLGDLVRRYITRAGLNVTGSCHLFRHACATHMLEAGCDIRFIQALLGHGNLATTEIYTQVSIRKLKEIHAATHPARLERRGGENGAAVDANLNNSREALLSALMAEHDEDAERVAADAPEAARR